MDSNMSTHLSGLKEEVDGDRAMTSARILKRINFSDILDQNNNKKRTVVISLDSHSMSGRTVGYLGFVPADPACGLNFDIDHEGFDNQGAQTGNPEGGFRIEFLNSGYRILNTNLDGYAGIIADVDWRQSKIAAMTNDQRHFRFEVGDKTFVGYINGRKMIEAPVNSFKLRCKRYYMIWSMLGYNPRKDGDTWGPDQVHYNNVAFDGPAGVDPDPDPVVHTYYEKNNGSSNLYSEYHPIVKINVPDDTSDTDGHPGKVKLYVTHEKRYDNSKTNRVLINGTPVNLPKLPEKQNYGGGWGPGDTTFALNGVGVPTSVDIPTNLIKKGINDIQFDCSSEKQLNLRLAVLFPPGKAPAYTPPMLAAPGLAYPGANYPEPDFPKFGPEIFMTGLNSELGQFAGTPSAGGWGPFLVSAKGMAEIGAMSRSYAQFKSTGVNLGVSYIVLLVDGQEVDRWSSSIDFPTPRTVHSFFYDTRKLTNGDHTFEVVSYNLENIKSYTWGPGYHASKAIVTVKN